MKKQFLEAGKIVTTHGIAGEVRVQSWCDDGVLTGLSRLYFDGGRQMLRVESARPHKNIIILKLEGIDDMNTAQQMRGRVLYLNRDDLELEADTYFIQDLIGCTVADYHDPSVVYGVIRDVTQTGANDVYHIETGEKKILLAPVIPDVVKNVDIDQGFILITPLEGLFDDAD